VPGGPVVTQHAVDENIEVLHERKYSTIVLRPGDGRKEIDISIFKDHTWAPDPGKAKVPCRSYDPGYERYRCLSGVDFKDESRYVQVDPSRSGDTPQTIVLEDRVEKQPLIPTQYPLGS